MISNQNSVGPILDELGSTLKREVIYMNCENNINSLKSGKFNLFFLNEIDKLISRDTDFPLLLIEGSLAFSSDFAMSIRRFVNLHNFDTLSVNVSSGSLCCLVNLDKGLKLGKETADLKISLSDILMDLVVNYKGSSNENFLGQGIIDTNNIQNDCHAMIEKLAESRLKTIDGVLKMAWGIEGKEKTYIDTDFSSPMMGLRILNDQTAKSKILEISNIAYRKMMSLNKDYLSDPQEFREFVHIYGRDGSVSISTNQDGKLRGEHE